MPKRERPKEVGKLPLWLGPFAFRPKNETGFRWLLQKRDKVAQKQQ